MSNINKEIREMLGKFELEDGYYEYTDAKVILYLKNGLMLNYASQRRGSDG